MCAALAVASLDADAALFVTNNTTCDLSLDVYASDANMAGHCSYYIWFKVPAGASQAYNNTGFFNTAGYIWRETSQGPSGYTTMLPDGKWDAASVAHYPATPQVGRAGSCALGTLGTGTVSSCNYTVTWTSLGGNNVFVEINP